MGIVSMPSKTEECLGGHAVMCVGFNEFKKVFIVRNSWGASWGAKGYFYLPYEYMLNKDWVSDFWTIRKVVYLEYATPTNLSEILSNRSLHSHRSDSSTQTETHENVPKKKRTILFKFVCCAKGTKHE
jgi:C1A family cysteine protease